MSQPHAGNILSGIKTWEMRSTGTHVRERIGIIPSGSGHIAGEVDLVSCLPAIELSDAQDYFRYHRVEDISLLSKWKFPWVLENPQYYVNAVPYNHPKGAVIWVKLDSSIICK